MAAAPRRWSTNRSRPLPTQPRLSCRVFVTQVQLGGSHSFPNDLAEGFRRGRDENLRRDDIPEEINQQDVRHYKNSESRVSQMQAPEAHSRCYAEGKNHTRESDPFSVSSRSLKLDQTMRAQKSSGPTDLPGAQSKAALGTSSAGHLHQGNMVSQPKG